jgi:hypothetical protein
MVPGEAVLNWKEIPFDPLPEMIFLSSEVVPPIMVLFTPCSKRIPFLWFGIAIFPVTSVPIKLPIIFVSVV